MKRLASLHIAINDWMEPGSCGFEYNFSNNFK